MADSAGVLVLTEMDGGSLSSTAAELLAAGREVSEGLGLCLSLAVTGSDVGSAAQEAATLGAQRVYAAEDGLLTGDPPELVLEAWSQICRQTSPAVVLIARTTAGRDLAPRLAVRLGVGLAQDCLEVTVNEASGRMIAHRPVYGGNAMAAVVCNGTPQMACIRPKAYEPSEPDDSQRAEVIPLSLSLDDSMARVKLVERVAEESEGVQLESAKIVVAGGRGLGSPAPFKDLEVIAGLLGAGSRRIAGRSGCGLGASLVADRVDGQDHYAGPVHNGSHQRGQPAHGGLLRLEGDRGGEQGRGGQHLQGSPLRSGGRLAEGAPQLYGDAARASVVNGRGALEGGTHVNNIAVPRSSSFLATGIRRKSAENEEGLRL